MLLQGIALLGALVGGVLARKRRYELVRLSQKLRKVNAKLRQRAGEGVCFSFCCPHTVVSIFCRRCANFEVQRNQTPLLPDVLPVYLSLFSSV